MKFDEFINAAKVLKQDIEERANLMREQPAFIEKYLDDTRNDIIKALNTNNAVALDELYLRVKSFESGLLHIDRLDAKRDKKITLMLELIGHHKPLSKKKKRAEIEKLIDAFEHVSKYNKIIEILVTEGYCQPTTYIWKVRNKGLLIGLLNHLELQGYYSNKLKPHEKQLIALNTFGVEVSRRITYIEIADAKIRRIIPPASALS